MTWLLAALLSAAPAFSQSLGELSGLAGPAELPPAPKAAPRVPAGARRACPAGWRRNRAGDCWVEAQVFPGEGRVQAYVHPAGFLVDPRCLRDKRFSADELLAALTTLTRKVDPALGADQGGCLGTYNPAWGRELKDLLWTKELVLSCPQDYDPGSETCADEDESPGYSLISLRNIKGCLGEGTTGLSGTLFHEFLHAARADNVPTAVHNQGWTRKQYEFIYDRVYGTEAVCYEGRKANVVQCRTAVAYDNDSPNYGLCRGFNAYFTDQPPGTIK